MSALFSSMTADRVDEVLSRTSPNSEADKGDPLKQHVQPLLDQLIIIRKHMVEQAAGLADQIDGTDPTFRLSAANLARYVGLSQHDLRSLQEGLAEIGLSSLGRSESRVLSSVDAVLRAGYALTGQVPALNEATEAAVPSAVSGSALLAQHTAALLGPEPPERSVRIMVTLPREAADDYSLVSELVASGMDCARINCAHDDVKVWRHMANNVRRAAKDQNRSCRLLVDIAGPKLRIQELPPGPAVVKWSPRKDALGMVLEPAHVWLFPEDMPLSATQSADACLPVPRAWLTQLRSGDRVDLRDNRAKQRHLLVSEVTPTGCWADAHQSAYVLNGTCLRIAPREHGPRAARRKARVERLPAIEGSVLLHPGDRLIVTSDACHAAHSDRDEALPGIPASLPPDLKGVHAGQTIWFDDGKVGGQIRRVGHGEIEVEITHARITARKLRADRSINLPDSILERPWLFPKDLEDLGFEADYADMVGLSFAESPEGIEALTRALRQHTERQIGIILKIETRRGFERLPQLLFAAMRHYPVGIMIARGDLAVECGYERLAEVQEEMLWLCEAAHLPVVWATQVLDQLTRTGQPSRAEITDAAMGERAECVMLNKGPHVVEAVRALGDILARMQAHQHKKRSLFRKLHVSSMGEGS